MATDQSFHEWASRAPGALARLAGVEASSPYEWQSIVLKRTEHRMDGLLKPLQETAPLVFVEFQGYADPRFLRRWLHGIAMHLHQAEHSGPVHAFVLYLKPSHAASEVLEWGWGRNAVLWFRPASLVLGSTPPAQILGLGLPELIPLLPLTQVQ